MFYGTIRQLTIKFDGNINYKYALPSNKYSLKQFSFSQQINFI